MAIMSGHQRCRHVPYRGAATRDPECLAAQGPGDLRQNMPSSIPAPSLQAPLARHFGGDAGAETLLAVAGRCPRSTRRSGGMRAKARCSAWASPYPQGRAARGGASRTLNQEESTPWLAEPGHLKQTKKKKHAGRTRGAATGWISTPDAFGRKMD